MILESLDGREELVTNITVERNGEMIHIRVKEIVPPNSLWRASILAYGCESDRIVTNYELSKLLKNFGRFNGIITSHWIFLCNP